MKLLSIPLLALLAAPPLTIASGCSGAYYSLMEEFGREKRDILVSRVKEARNDQQEVQEEFKTTFEQFKELTNYQGGALESKYNDLSRALQRSEARASDLSGRIRSIEDVGGALFREWEAELDQYTDRNLRASSERMMRDTRNRFDDMLAAMRRAEARMEPVLQPFREQVLFLKHNLNASAVANLQGTALQIQDDISVLIREMEASITKADRFLSQMDRAS